MSPVRIGSLWFVVRVGGGVVLFLEFSGELPVAVFYDSLWVPVSPVPVEGVPLSVPLV